MYRWNADGYAQHSQGQERWARELLAEISLQANEQVLDVGCGDGRITASIAAQIPQGRVTGVDLSPDMIAHAQRHFANVANLSFRQMNASELTFDHEFTLVFSNAALHWVRHHQPVLAGVSRALRTGGRFIAQMGGAGNGAGMIAAFESIAALPRWREYFSGFSSTYGFHHPDDYARWLQAVGLHVQQCELIDKDMLHADQVAFTGWIRTAWHPYTSPIPEVQRELFIREVVAQYLQTHGTDARGQVRVRMVRLQVRATKI